MILIETFFLPGDVNMALDVEMGRLSFKLKEPILRIYTWERMTLSIGRLQKLSDVDFESLKRFDVDCVRRPTGGRAVLHWNEVTYSVVFPKGTEEFSMRVVELYRRISEILAKAFRKLGAGVEFSEGAGWDPKNPSCFSSGARYELKINGKKFVGSAQVRMRNFVLQHGSIMLKPNWNILSRVLSDHPSVDFLSRKAIGLSEVSSVKFRDIVNLVEESFDEFYKLRWMEYSEVLDLLRISGELRGDYSCQSSI